jgi:hypothetical protein
MSDFELVPTRLSRMSEEESVGIGEEAFRQIAAMLSHGQVKMTMSQL